MKWLLDTNILSELMKSQPHAALLAWLEAHEAESFLCSISIGEMVCGIERLPSGKKRRRLERALKFLREDYAERLLDFTEGAAVEWGRLVAQAQKQGAACEGYSKVDVGGRPRSY